MEIHIIVNIAKKITANHIIVPKEQLQHVNVYKD